MNTSLSSILQTENLEHLLTNFTDQGVTDSILADLSDADLKDLGIDKLGERKRLLAAFKGGSSPSMVVPVAATPTSVETPVTVSPATVSTPAQATKGSPFVNSLGMPFVPIPRFDTRFCIWPVRVQDYEAYCMDSGAKFPSCPFPQDSDHPIVGVSWNDAIEFSVWLTVKERAEGKIDGKTIYRLPTDLEWSAAVGLPHEPEATPENRHLKAPGYPWGLRWPPPRNSGNYEHRRDDQLCIKQTAQCIANLAGIPGPDPDYAVIDMFNRQSREWEGVYIKWRGDWVPVDDYEFTSPVGSFSPNTMGVFDLGGNVWEWCMDYWSPSFCNIKIARGGAYSLGFTKPIDGDDFNWTHGRLHVSIDNCDLYRSSYRVANPEDKHYFVNIHSGIPLVNDNLYVDQRGWKSYPNGGIRLALVTDVT